MNENTHAAARVFSFHRLCTNRRCLAGRPLAHATNQRQIYRVRTRIRRSNLGQAVLAPLLMLAPTACATAGSAWMREGYGSGANTGEWDDQEIPKGISESETRPPLHRTPSVSHTLAPPETRRDDREIESANDGSPTRIVQTGPGHTPRRNRPIGPFEGKSLGTFRNTYYDFPTEGDFGGDQVTVYNGQCQAIARVARGFFEAVCVQGSGLLASGSPISFNRRDCECAEVCPRTQQKICFDPLEIGRFPWGRGANGSPITPLLTVAVDTNVVPLGTSLYIPEFEGLPRDPARKSLHDGCFVAEDRGLRVQGRHVDLFTGLRAMTELWNGLVPSNSGVTVVIDNPKCKRASP
jgi:3D (Asp-Asp-Asp) domain-containing protein